MCRNITTLRGLEPVATVDEIEAAALQYVRKVSGIGKVSARTEEAVERAVRGHPMAKAAIEMAAWDLHCRMTDKPLAVAIGGSIKPVDVGVSIGLQPDTDTLLGKVEGYLDEGYKRIKMKIKPGWDVDADVAIALPGR